MASAYPGPVSAVQVGSYFVGQYYQVLQQQPDLVHQFYSEASSMIRVDGDSIDSASAMLHIHTLILSLNFTAIEIKTINSLDSWNGGILVMVSGSVKTKEFSGRRKFVQTFVLAPQEKGYFVLNDIFQFIDDGMIYQNPTSILPESKFDSQLNASSPLPEPPVSDYGLEEEAREYVSSVHIEDDPVDKYSLPEQQQQYGLPEQQQQYGLPEQQQQYGLPEQQQQYGLPEQQQQYGLPEQQLQQDLETEIVVEETPIEETSSSLQTAVDVVQENPSVAQEELVGETQKKTYASILRVAKGQSAPSVVTQPSFMGSQTASDWNHSPQPLEQQSNSALSFGPETGVEPAEESYALEEEGEPKSVYVRNLPPDVTEVEIEQEFKNFGRIKPDGVFIRLRKEFGVCYAFVEFEDIIGVHNALKASPIQLAGRQIYVEERRPNSSGVSRGGRGRGRGRGIYQAESTRGRFGGRSFGRGNQDVGDYNRLRGNGFHQRGSR